MRSYRIETYRKYPVHVVINLLIFVRSQFSFDKLKEEVKGLFALLGRFLAENSEQIDASHYVC